MSGATAHTPTWVIFGAGGFVGSHLSRHLLALPARRRIILSDLRFSEARMSPAVREAIASGRLETVIADLRQPIDRNAFPDRVDVIINLAAICREPDFPPKDFFEVNVVGGRHVADWATQVDCPQILFTSSIAVYGGDRGRITESTLPVPFHAYGSSKLAAEEIFRGWRNGDPQHRSLTILRPGVIFGPGENANVHRLIRAVRRGYFFYCGNRDLPKAGAYVDELCRALTWMQSQEAGKARLVIANFASPTPPTLSEYVETIQRVAGWRRWIPSVPYGLLYHAARVFNAIVSLFGISTPIHPRRVEKLKIANDVIPQSLVEQGYPFHYTLEEGLRRWREEAPEEWT
ncbi:MAG TPA: NAD(P)-dependent oxidoreductase [Nevskiaceae bacterium]|nr:NAD(P)-dependent oxidoreductase [Nevskiaceae bacterium]